MTKITNLDQVKHFLLRMMSHLSKLFIFSVFILSHLLSEGQVIVSGKVFYNRKVLKGAAISSSAKSSSPVLTDRSGAFKIETGGRGDRLLISKKGYISKSVVIGSQAYVTVTLEKLRHSRTRRFEGRRKIKCPPSNPLCGCCFYKGTRILLKDGSEKNIEQVRPGDLILSTDLKDLTVQADSVLAIDSVAHHNLIGIELENEIKVISTTDHPYFVEGKGWCAFDPQLTKANYNINSGQLKAGDHCLMYSEGKLKPVTIRTIKKPGKSGMTYNISGLHKRSNYFANGILVSNEKEVPQLSEK